MPRLLTDFATTEPADITVYQLDFTAYLPTGKTISSSVWGLAVHYVAPEWTADPTPSARLSGSATVAGAVVSQKISGLIAGNTYLVTALATLNDGQVIELWCYLPCRVPS